MTTKPVREFTKEEEQKLLEQAEKDFRKNAKEIVKKTFENEIKKEKDPKKKQILKDLREGVIKGDIKIHIDNVKIDNKKERRK